MTTKNKAAYQKKWRYDYTQGKPRYVNPEPARKHARTLIAKGATQAAIARASGVSQSQIARLLTNQYTHTQRRIRDAILQTRIENITHPNGDTGLTPAHGTIRRIQALMALGHPAPRIAQATGDPTATKITIYNALHADQWVTLTTRNLIIRAYEALSMTPGTSTWSRNHATKRGWAPPLAWDDIDDPTERPRGLRTRGEAQRSAREERVDRIRDLAGAGKTDREIGWLIGIEREAVCTTRNRYGIPPGVPSGRGAAA